MTDQMCQEIMANFCEHQKYYANQTWIDRLLYKELLCIHKKFKKMHKIVQNVMNHAILKKVLNHLYLLILLLRN